MDTVRFGRALGSSARHAAKSLLSAADAATAPNPRATPRTATSSTTTSSPPRTTVEPTRPADAPPKAATLPPALTATPPSRTGRPHPSPVAASAAHAATTARGLAEGSRRFGRAVWAPAVRLSGVLWLELTGVFFALFALVAGIAAWRLRASLLATASASAPGSDDRTRLLFAAGMVFVFGYFSLTSFLKARRRSQRP